MVRYRFPAPLDSSILPTTTPLEACQQYLLQLIPQSFPSSASFNSQQTQYPFHPVLLFGNTLSTNWLRPTSTSTSSPCSVRHSTVNYHLTSPSLQVLQKCGTTVTRWWWVTWGNARHILTVMTSVSAQPACVCVSVTSKLCMLRMKTGYIPTQNTDDITTKSCNAPSSHCTIFLPDYHTKGNGSL